MYLTSKITDCNGFCLFDPTRLRQVLAREPAEDENLFSLFLSSELGDEVLRAGAVVPVYPITDGRYTLCLRAPGEAFPSASLKTPALARTGVYPLHVLSRLVLADLTVLQQWTPELAWDDVPIEPGFYSVVVSAHEGQEPGFDIVLAPGVRLPEYTATFDTDIDVVMMRAPLR